MSITGDEKALLEKKSEIKTRRIISYITWFVILFVPTYAITDTQSGYGLIKETVFLFPWMIFIHFQPSEIFSSNEYVVISIPWSYLLFIPFIYAFMQTWELYNSGDKKVINSVYIIFASIIQLLIISMTFKSQSSGISEEVKVFYVPQLIIITIHSFTAFFWFSDEISSVSKSKDKKVSN